MKVEKHSIDYIPENERHGSPKSLFTIWFSQNMQIVALVMGALAVVFGLNLFWSIVAIVIGNLVGAVFMAYHSAQGPKLGIPQMIQSRAQFGVIGAILPLILVLIMYIGFSSTGAILNAQAVRDIVPMPIPLAIVLSNCIAFIIALYGYNLIHKINRYLSIVFAVVFFIVTFLVLKTPLPAHSWSLGHFDIANFLLVVSIMATWQLTYAPYVADYSRYLPKDTPVRKTFMYTYAGTVISSVWMMILGAFLAILIPNFSDEPTKGLSIIVGHHFSMIIDLIIILGTVSGTPIGFYGAFMSLITSLEPFMKFRGTPKVRFWLMLLVAAVCTAIPIWTASNFLHNFSNFLTLLMYFMVPWTAINLVDYYFVRKSEYNVQDIFNVNGQYGRFNWIAICSYIVGSLVEIPFANTTFYVGPIAKAWGGADVAWIIGLVVSSVLYYYPMKRMLKTQKEFVHQLEL